LANAKVTTLGRCRCHAYWAQEGSRRIKDRANWL